MKTKLLEIIKNSPFIYSIYFYSISFVINFIKLFLKTDEKLVLFVAYGGRHFNDSPRTLYEAMQKDERFSNYKLVWAFRNPNDFEFVPNRIKIDTFEYFKTALKSRVWITNVYIERGLYFKGIKTYYLHTTHTVFPKLMASHALAAGNDNFSVKGGYHYDCSCAQSKYEQKMQAEMFDIPIDNVKLTGYPKNDVLINFPKEKKFQIRDTLGIAPDKIVILYAPTYRDESKVTQSCPINFDLWNKVLGDKYVVLFRAHPVIVNMTHFDSNSNFVIDVSNYQVNTDLMAVADILISDYSGIFFEFGVQEKPMFCYAYDYDDYIKTRGLYFDIREKIPGGFMNEEELLNYIKNGDNEEIMEKVNEFRKEQITYFGNATKQCLDLISDNIQKGSQSC
jgi:CDP-glycerol glycerophosphotransferase